MLDSSSLANPPGAMGSHPDRRTIGQFCVERFDPDQRPARAKEKSSLAIGCGARALAVILAPSLLFQAAVAAIVRSPHRGGSTTEGEPLPRTPRRQRQRQRPVACEAWSAPN